MSFEVLSEGEGVLLNDHWWVIYLFWLFSPRRLLHRRQFKRVSLGIRMVFFHSLFLFEAERRLELLVEPAFGWVNAWLLWFHLDNIAHNAAQNDGSFVVRAGEAAVWKSLGTDLVRPGLVTHAVEVVGETGPVTTGLSGTV